jgi:predicted deacylase
MARCYTPSPDVVSRRIRGEQILVPIAGSMDRLDSIYALNEVASLICSLAADGKSDDAIAAELASRYDVTLEQARADTQQILSELVALGALRPET